MIINRSECADSLLPAPVRFSREMLFQVGLSPLAEDSAEQIKSSWIYLGEVGSQRSDAESGQ